MDSSVFTRSTGSPGRISLGRSNAARRGQERRVGRDELVLARESDDFINRRLILAFTLNLLQKCIHASRLAQAQGQELMFDISVFAGKGTVARAPAAR